MTLFDSLGLLELFGFRPRTQEVAGAEKPSANKLAAPITRITRRDKLRADNAGDDCKGGYCPIDASIYPVS